MASKRLNYFLSTEDEARLSGVLRDAFPSLEFIDDQRWPSLEPPVRRSIDSCNARFVYIWNRALFPTLPTKSIGGHIQGPSTHYVIQFQRNKQKDGFMESAQLSIGYDEENSEHRLFSEKIYRLVKKQHSHTLRAVDINTGQVLNPKLNNFVLGAHAAEQVRRGMRLVIAFGRPEVLELAGA